MFLARESDIAHYIRQVWYKNDIKLSLDFVFGHIGDDISTRALSTSLGTVEVLVLKLFTYTAVWKSIQVRIKSHVI